MSGPDRRTFLRSVGGATVALGVAGCVGDGGGGDGGGDGGGEPTDAATVQSGANNSLKFEPERVALNVGGTVTWEFPTPGHNVSCKPDAAEPVELPEGAEPFASYDGDDHYDTIPRGETYEYTFETPGKYTYVCVPHVASNMIGHVEVVE